MNKRVIGWGLGFAAVLAIGVVATTWWSRPAASRALSAAEFDPVVREIDAIQPAHGSYLEPGAAGEATPERIERLYRSADLARLSYEQRKKGLVLAGHGPLLQFEAPSDVVKAIERWFPQEMAAGRADAKPVIPMVLSGPFASWDDEAAAFMTLWNCMPRRAWLRPDASPFDPEIDPLGSMAIASTSSNDLDFGHCVKQRSGWRYAPDESQRSAIATERATMAARVTPVLARHFEQHLARQKCNGTGPDDCALVGLLWSSLTPEDPKLVAALRAMESSVQLDAPWASRTALVDGSLSVDQKRMALLQMLRHAAFLRAAFQSITAAPQAWPAEALPRLLEQLAALQDFYQGFDQITTGERNRWFEFGFRSRNAAIDPWGALAPLARQAAALPALQAQIQKMAARTDCDAMQRWAGALPAAARVDVAVDALRFGYGAACITPDWDWLRGNEPEAAPLRQRLASEAATDNGLVHERILEGLTIGGEACAADEVAKQPATVQALCREWVSEPPVVPKLDTLPRSGRKVLPGDRYTALTAAAAPEALVAKGGKELDAWVVKQLGDVGLHDTNAYAVLDHLRGTRQRVVHIQPWRLADSGHTLVEMQLDPIPMDSAKPAASSANEQGKWPYIGGSRLLLVMTDGDPKIIAEPYRFRSQNEDDAITQVTDIDHDGHPEVWLTGTVGECDDENAKPGVDCAVPVIHMGEAWDNALSFFVMTPAAK